MFELAKSNYDGIAKVRAAQAEIRKLRDQLKTLKEKTGEGTVASSLAALDQKVAAIEGAPGGFGSRGGGSGLARLAGEMLSVMNIADDADAAPTTQAVAASAALQKSLADALAGWNEIKSKDVKAINEQLRQAGLPALAL